MAGLLDVFNFGTGGSYYADRQKEIDKKYRTIPVAGGKVDMTIDRKSQELVGATTPNQLPPGMRIEPIKKRFDPSQGGLFNKDGTTLGKGDISKDNLNFFSKLTGLNFKQLQGEFKKEGGFETLMSNPAFTLGLAVMQSSAQGKRIDAGLMDNFVKAAGISEHFKDRIEARKLPPIEATAGDVAEVKDLLKTLKVDEPNWFERVAGNLQGKDVTAAFDQAAESIAIEYQKEVDAIQKANIQKTGKRIVIDTEFKKRIIQKLLKEKKFKHKKGWLGGLFTKGTLETKDKTGSQFWENKAQGGPVTKGQPYVVGEGGPEYFLPKESGKIISNDDSRIFAMLLSANPQLQNVSRTRAEKILRNRFPEYFD